jgi:hypothetical protein
MYHNFNSLRESIQKEIESQKSVLNKFPEHISRPITQSVSRYLAQFTSYQLPLKPDRSSNPQDLAEMITSSTNSNNASSSLASANSSSTNSNSGSHINDGSDKTHIIQLETSEQVNWTLENLMYGLTLSHEHHEIIKDCWHIYHDWLSVLLDEPRSFLPQPIRDEPIMYARKMLWHLYHLFVPRREGQAAPTKHIMMCHGVLILIESIAKDSKLLRRELWEDFLKFFLAINDAVLAPPFNKGIFFLKLK